MRGIARDAIPFLLPLVGIVAVLFALRQPAAAAAALLVAGFVAFFFRDPERASPQGERLVLAPADGKVVAIAPFPAWRGPSGEDLQRVSIFLSVLDVHINRAPLTSVVNGIDYRPGAFRVAWTEEASVTNEQNLIQFASPDGDVWVKQIAGILARRIVCWVKPGQKLRAGDRIGLIRFGSRVDLILPARVPLRVRVGDHVTGGVTVVGVLP